MCQRQVRISAVIAGITLTALGTVGAANTVSHSDIPGSGPMRTGVTVTQRAGGPALAKATPDMTGPVELPEEERGLPGR